MTTRNLEFLLTPRALVWLGRPSGRVQIAQFDMRLANPPLPFHHWEDHIPANAALPTGTLAVIAAEAFAAPDTVRRLGQLGCRALLWALPEAPDHEVLAAAGEHTVRILGPRSVGLAHQSGLNLSSLVQTPLPGSLALIVQSQSVAATAVDWACGRNIGFSWVAATGGECDVDVSDLLDYAALDRNTRAVAVEVGRIRGARKFMSAARACARAKPTVILQTRQAAGCGPGADPVRSAAFARAGLVEVPDLPGLFDAITALQRLPAMDRGQVLVAANSAAVCALTADAVLRQGLRLAELDEPCRSRISALLPDARFRQGAVDLGEPDAEQMLAALGILKEWPGKDALIFARSPVAGYPHLPLANALARAKLGPQVLTVWLGLESAAPARRLSAGAGQSVFTSPQAAARAIRYRWEYACNRELLTQTPPPTDLRNLHPDDVARRLREQLDAGGAGPAAALELLTAYGIPRAFRRPAQGLELDLRLQRHPELGMHLRLQVGGCATQMATGPAPVHGFVPMDVPIATRLLHAAGITADGAVEARDLAAAREALIRLAQLAMDQPLVELLAVRLIVRAGRARALKEARLRLTATPPAERARLALAPYPAHHARRVVLGKGASYELRPVRPQDEPEVIELLQSLDAASVRLRFFSPIRHFSHTMAARMTQIDYDREFALVVYGKGGEGPLLAIGTLVADPDGRSAEFALLVHPAYKRKGLGRLLLSAFVAQARRKNVDCVWGIVLPENIGMLSLARDLGFAVRVDPEERNCMRVELLTSTA
ncbi:MAG: GNAT family N-acetyltransferase [Panacagrimonas sp.]